MSHEEQDILDPPNAGRAAYHAVLCDSEGVNGETERRTQIMQLLLPTSAKGTFPTALQSLGWFGFSVPNWYLQVICWRFFQIG